MTAQALADRLDAARARMVALASRSEQSGLTDATGWRTAVEQVEQVAGQAGEVAQLLHEALGWLETGNGGPPLPEDFAGGLERIQDAIAMLRARA